MSDVNVNFPPSASPARFVSAGDVDAMITQIKADVEGQVSVISGQLTSKAPQDVVDALLKKTTVISVTEPPYNATADWNGTTGTNVLTAIQNCINNAPLGSTVFIPKQTSPYYIGAQLNVKSGISVISNGATIVAPSSDTLKPMLYGNLITNFTIKGLTLKGATRDKTRARGGLTSNLYGFHINRSSGIVFEDMKGENLEMLFKTDLDSNDFTMNNISSVSTYQPIYMTGTSKVRGKNWTFDCPTDGSTLDHHMYLNSGMKDWEVSDITLKNGTGHAIAIANTNSTDLVNRDMYFNNVKFFDVFEGIILSYGDIQNINFNGVYGKGIAVSRNWLSAGLGATGKIIENITVSNFFFENTLGSLFAFTPQNGVYPTNVTFRNGTVKGQTGGHTLLPDGGINTVLDNVTFTEAQPTGSARFIFSSTTANPLSLTLNNCTVIWGTVAPNNPPISVRNTSAYEVIIKNSRFLNRLADHASLCWNYGGGVALFKNNEFAGFTALNNAADTATTFRENFNLKTKTMI